ncbi:hypothetical protein Poli38472_010214 [Pythium oligandrum]|uniref:Uncharacterized protein n=1 Tax=Pythium oligandrum TaxID=41045 RepID=A0A8K1C9B2_PYTOL|nr:hypothetical protein Poli38472_010214 [Pythium oligandrum]|eukprot:TMW58655.1 hypothetical protein Poli38472_010214 [Pythium oligandrum]
MESPRPGKKPRFEANDRQDKEKGSCVEDSPRSGAGVALCVLGNASLFRHAVSFLDGLPMLFHGLAEKHDITWMEVALVRQQARRSSVLAMPDKSFRFDVTKEQRQALANLKKANASYMEMAIQDGDLSLLKLIYRLHKQGIAKEHPRFGFHNPMRHAAANGRLEMLVWLSQQEERNTWLNDDWLLDAALSSYKLDVVQWVHKNYVSLTTFIARTQSLDLVASHGALDLLRWTLSTFPKSDLTTEAMDGAAANGQLEMIKYLHEERTDGRTTRAIDKADD